MKKLVILILILLVLGLYYYTDSTKDAMSIVGSHSLEVGEKVFDEVSDTLKESEKVDGVKEKMKEALG